MAKTIAKGTKIDQETFPEITSEPKERLIQILKNINETDSNILKTGKGGYFDLLLTLIKSGFSTQCPTSNVNYRTWYKFDTDEEKRLATCVDEGFRMQKSLTKDSINLLMKDCPKEKAQAAAVAPKPQAQAAAVAQTPPTVITQAPAVAPKAQAPAVKPQAAASRKRALSAPRPPSPSPQKIKRASSVPTKSKKSKKKGGTRKNR